MNIGDRKELNNKIESEERHFEGIMLAGDSERFKALCKLYWKQTSYVEADALSYGFRLAARLMTDVFTTVVTEKDNQK